jgi:hypothetical protein
MSEPLHEMPASIELSRAEYRAQHAALEAALDVVDRFPEVDATGTVRDQIERALRGLLRRIWPYLEELDDDD